MVLKANPISWFESYFSEGKQYIQAGNQTPSLQDITCGVPQGSSSVSTTYK